MMSGGREVDVGGEGPNCLNTVQDHLFERSTASSDSRPLQDGNYSFKPARNSFLSLPRFLLPRFLLDL